MVFSPHPAMYARIADKRNLSLLSARVSSSEVDDKSPLSVIPRTCMLSDESLEYWQANRKRLVL